MQEKSPTPRTTSNISRVMTPTSAPTIIGTGIVAATPHESLVEADVVKGFRVFP
jgi:hypothetical protein